MEKATKIMEFLEGRYKVEEYPVLQSQFESWSVLKPFEGLKILDVTPIFKNTLLKHRNLLAGGAELILGCGEVISSDAEVLDFCRGELGLKILEAEETIKGWVDIVLDCAGSFVDLPAKIGYVELTGSGIEKYKNSGKLCYAADSSKIKLQETVLGTGESFFRAMYHLGYRDWSDKVLVVFGSGKVGRGIVRYGQKSGCRIVVVSDLSGPIEGMEGVEMVDYRDKEAVERVVKDAYCVVMATGVKGALSKTIDKEVLGEGPLPLVVNMGAEDEIGEAIADSRVVENKRTVNFILDEPTHLKFIETTMALHNYGAKWLAENHTTHSGIIIPTKEIEDEILLLSCVSL